MSRKNDIKKLKEEIQKCEIKKQEFKKELDRFEGYDDLKMSELWNALENIDGLKGFKSKTLKIELSTGQDDLYCTIISNYLLEEEQMKIVKSVLKQQFEVDNVNIECKK